jgi:nucleoside-diphosphate-sugar epimerase
MIVRPVLVTGAGGFIGQALVERLRAAGTEVVRVRNLEDDPAWSGPARNCSAVVHLANIAHARVDAAELERVNVQGTRRLAEQALTAGVPRFVYVSSIKVHGEQSRAGGFSSASPIDPGDAYGEAKARAEAVLQELARQRLLKLTVLRPPLVYGPGVKANFLALIRAIARGLPLPLGSTRNRRSLIYVGNLADAILRCLENGASVGGSYPVSDGASVSTTELCRALGRALARPARLFAFPPALLEGAAALLGRRAAALSLTRDLEVDCSHFREELDWRPPSTLTEGLQATAAWFRGRGIQ